MENCQGFFAAKEVIAAALINSLLTLNPGD
jgi:hypothetical protein